MHCESLTNYQRSSGVGDYGKTQSTAALPSDVTNVAFQQIMGGYQHSWLHNEPGSLSPANKQFVELSSASEGPLQAAMYAMDMLRVGYLLISENGVVLSLNNVANGILGSQTCLNMQEGRLICKNSSDNSQLHKSVMKAAQVLSPSKNADVTCDPVHMLLPLDRQDAVLSMALFPAHGSNHRSARENSNVVMVITLDDVAQILSESFLSSSFGMTRAEARLTQLLARGRTLQEAAECLCLSIHTIRSQLRAILAKTGARRQAELVSQVWRARWLRIG